MSSDEPVKTRKDELVERGVEICHTTEEVYEELGIDLSMREIIEEETGYFLEIIPGQELEQRGTFQGKPMTLTEDTFCPVIDVVMEAVPKMSVPFALHCSQDSDAFLKPLLLFYLTAKIIMYGIPDELYLDVMRSHPEFDQADIVEMIHQYEKTRYRESMLNIRD